MLILCILRGKKNPEILNVFPREHIETPMAHLAKPRRMQTVAVNLK
jgi:hypothetical protein